MNESISEMKSKLALWQKLPSHGPQAYTQQKDFVRRFPLETLENMTIREFARSTSIQGSINRDSFCHWLEDHTYDIWYQSGGNPSKFGVWWNVDSRSWQWNTSFYNSQDHAFITLKTGILELLRAAQSGQFEDLDEIGTKHLEYGRYHLLLKPLYLYFPEDFLPITKINDLKRFLNRMGETPCGDLVALNRQLLKALRTLSETQGLDTLQLKNFLYLCLK